VKNKIREMSTLFIKRGCRIRVEKTLEFSSGKFYCHNTLEGKMHSMFGKDPNCSKLIENNYSVSGQFKVEENHR